MKTLRLSTTLLSTPLIMSFIFGCSPPEIEPPKKPKPAPTREYTVNLPPSVNLEGKIPPLKDNQGNYRVDGLLMHPREILEKNISLTAYVAEISKCKERPGEVCDKPHFWITYSLGDTEARLRVVDMERKDLKKFRVGKQYVFEGLFSQTSKSGYMNSRGLLRLTKHQKIR